MGGLAELHAGSPTLRQHMLTHSTVSPSAAVCVPESWSTRAAVGGGETLLLADLREESGRLKEGEEKSVGGLFRLGTRSSRAARSLWPHACVVAHVNALWKASVSRMPRATHDTKKPLQVRNASRFQP